MPIETFPQKYYNPTPPKKLCVIYLFQHLNFWTKIEWTKYEILKFYFTNKFEWTYSICLDLANGHF